MTEPAVIHNKHLDTKLGSLLCNGNQFIGIKLKIRSLPVIDQNRTLLVLPLAANQVIAVQVMEGTGHLAKTFV